MGVTTYSETFSVADTAGASASVTCTVKLSWPAAVVVPEITPVVLASFSPAGSDPEASDHAYGAMPPAALSLTEYGTPLVAVGRVLPVVTTSPETPTVMDSGAPADCAVVSESVTSAVKVKLPVWFDAKAAGSTPMCEALKLAHTTLTAWTSNHPYSFPPVVINITDGEATDGDPAVEAEALRNLSTQDGNLLLFNCHISGTSSDSILFADHEEGLPDQFAKLLFNMSSVLPEAIRESAQREGFKVSEKSRGFAFNADLVELIRFLDIGTRPSNMR